MGYFFTELGKGLTSIPHSSNMKNRTSKTCTSAESQTLQGAEPLSFTLRCLGCKSKSCSTVLSTVQALICCQDWIRSSNKVVNVEESIEDIDELEEEVRKSFKEATVIDV
ncbi:hypothetical protein OSB04_019531 [Centaurea solstitialis]|uniref:HAT C-terminal dimerisation domain-containing protein n=1 Tax=Centaurea solstitialis TaxID=347529 RepID=A0AA38SR21_9ASTR|nr:hypothetical protein OSB04_019531 [Centaurea solstitialis]